MQTDKLYVGVNYHPHDWSPERWKVDIELMKKAGLQVVRLGHLCWDSYEPDNGVYTFEWFDEVMDLFAQAGIGVFLDLAVRPAPAWVHELCPGCNIYDKSGCRTGSIRRYMEDVSDPDYQHYALRFARVMVERYKAHPALIGFGLCNEQGAGYMSFSPGALERFKVWLEEKYGTVDALNKAWATQRWSRRLRSFADVEMPENSIELGSPEAWLDMRRFYSDGIGLFMAKLARVVEEGAPGVPHSSNHYSGHTALGFDLLKYADSFVDYPGLGHYPNYAMDEKAHYAFTTFQERMNEHDKPMWCLEFLTNGLMYGPDGYVRMQTFLCLQHRMQMVLGWTWRTMLGGEEQFFLGLLEHDGEPSPVYHEYAQIARDFRKLEKYGFPFMTTPDIAVAFSQDSMWATMYNSFIYPLPYTQAILYAQKALFDQNRLYNMVNLRNLKKNYKLMIVPEHVVMDAPSAATLRRFVEEGGTVIMTGYSAMVDGTGKAFDTPRPGGLADVFGIRIAGFDRANQLDRKGYVQSENRTMECAGETIAFRSDYVERIELRGADCYATLDNGQCAVSVNSYGKGKAYYVASEANAELLGWLVSHLAGELGLKKPPVSPAGVQAREIAPGQVFYVNTTNEPVTVSLEQSAHGVLTEKDYTGEMTLAPYDGELLLFGEN